MTIVGGDIKWDAATGWTNRTAGRSGPSDPSRGSVAQRLEQGTHNPLVLGSNPSAPSSNCRSPISNFRLEERAISTFESAIGNSPDFHLRLSSGGWPADLRMALAAAQSSGSRSRNLTSDDVVTPSSFAASPTLPRSRIQQIEHQCRGARVVLVVGRDRQPTELHHLPEPRRRLPAARVDRMPELHRQAELEPSECPGLVLRLGAGFAREDDGPRRPVRQADAVAGLVPLLPARPGAAERVEPAVREQRRVRQVQPAGGFVWVVAGHIAVSRLIIATSPPRRQDAQEERFSGLVLRAPWRLGELGAICLRQMS